MHLRGISLAWAVCGVQGLIGAIAAVAMLGLRGKEHALAALYGAVVAVAPNVYFALRIYRRAAAEEPRAVVGRFYQAEIGKFALTGVLFFIGALLYAQQFLPLIGTYMACIAAYWVVLVFARID